MVDPEVTTMGSTEASRYGIPWGSSWADPRVKIGAGAVTGAVIACVGRKELITGSMIS